MVRGGWRGAVICVGSFMHHTTLSCDLCETVSAVGDGCWGDEDVVVVAGVDLALNLT